MPITPIEFKTVCDMVLRKSGIVLEAGKEYLVDARLTMLARKQGLASIADLLARVKTHGETAQRDIVDAMTTNETSFYRDIKPFETLKTQVMPALLAKRAAEKKLSIWCAASSTGQEPYSIAMMLRDAFPQLATWKLTFVASDLSRDVLEKAKAGRYTQTDINRGLPATMLVKHFRRTGLEWELTPEIRSMIDFKEINLLGGWPAFERLDVVFIRNVLIYFSQDTKRQILHRIRGLMKPDGYLFLGAAETTLNIDENFARLQKDDSGCHQLTTPAMKLAA